MNDGFSHLMGMFYRTIRMADNGIKPLYVFDGKPPEMKSDELTKRHVKRVEAEKEHEKAVEVGNLPFIFFDCCYKNIKNKAAK